MSTFKMSVDEEGEESSSSVIPTNLVTDFVFKPFHFQQLQLTNFVDLNRRLDGSKMVCDDEGNFYAFGSNSSQLWNFNAATNTWKFVKTTGTWHSGWLMPSVVLDEGLLVVFGGLSDRGFNDEVNICDLKTLEWQQKITTGPAPSARYNNAVILHEKNLYIIGGEMGTEGKLDVHKLDLVTSNWETLWTADSDWSEVEEPKSRIGPQVAFYEDKIILFGVFDYFDTNNFSKIPAFDVKSRTWTCLSTIEDFTSENGYPPSRCYHSTIQRGHEIFMFGGSNSNDLWKLNLLDLHWTKIAVHVPHISPIHATGLSPNGCMIVLSSLPMGACAWKCWLAVPTLRELGFEAICQFQPKLKDIPKDQLVANGIPDDLTRRLDI